MFALRQCLSAAVADGRLLMNPALDVPLPPERLKTPRFLSRDEVEVIVDAMPARYRALVLVGAFAGLRWGEAAGLTRANVDVLRSRIRVVSTAVEVRGHVMLGNEPRRAARSERFRLPAPSCDGSRRISPSSSSPRPRRWSSLRRKAVHSVGPCSRAGHGRQR